MSSSRVHCTLIGALAPVALRTLTTSTITSASATARRPKKPPGVITCSFTFERVDAHDLGAHRLIEVRHLQCPPQTSSVPSSKPRDRIERLHRGMGEVGKLELGLDHLGGARERAFGVAILARDRGIALRELLVFGHQLGGAAGLGGALVPFDGQKVPPLERGPGVLGHDRDPARRLDHVDHALDLPWSPRRRTISPCHRTAAGARAPRSACPAAGRRSGTAADPWSWRPNRSGASSRCRYRPRRPGP